MLSNICIKVYSYFKVRDSLVLFLFGCSLLLTGLHGISVSQITPEGWPNPANPAVGAPPLNGTTVAPRSPNTGVSQQSIWFGVAPRTANTNVAQNSPFKGVEDPLQWQLAQQPETPATGIAEAADVPYDDSLIRFSVGNLYKFIEGAFGALIVVGAGVGAIIAAAVGAYKAAMALFVTAIGAFILRAYVSLFFGTNYDDYTVGVDDVAPN